MGRLNRRTGIGRQIDSRGKFISSGFILDRGNKVSQVRTQKGLQDGDNATGDMNIEVLYPVLVLLYE
ncbi:hypothetical protein Bca4012_012415 [Brassica carinata]